MSGMVLHTYSHQRQLIDGQSITYITCLSAPTHSLRASKTGGIGSTESRLEEMRSDVAKRPAKQSLSSNLR